MLYDTVGCVVVDCAGRVAAGVSSGGILLKAEGRVGEAALYGCGCWAQDGGRYGGYGSNGAGGDGGDGDFGAGGGASLGGLEGGGGRGRGGMHEAAQSAVNGTASGAAAGSPPGVAVSVSGVGEAVMRSLLASEAGRQLRSRPHDPADQVRVGFPRKVKTGRRIK